MKIIVLQLNADVGFPLTATRAVSTGISESIKLLLSFITEQADEMHSESGTKITVPTARHSAREKRLSDFDKLPPSAAVRMEMMAIIPKTITEYFIGLTISPEKKDNTDENAVFASILITAS